MKILCKRFCVFLAAALIISSVMAEVKIEDALSLINQGKYKEAIPILETLKSADPGSVEILFNLGAAYLQTENYGLARTNLEAAVSRDPALLAAHYYLAFIYEKDRRFDAAISEWEKVISLAQKDRLKELAKKHIAEIQQKQSK